MAERRAQAKRGERLAFEEIGAIEIITLAFIAWLFISGHYTIAIVIAFFMGVGVAYLFDTHMSRIKGAEEYVYARKKGFRRAIEEFGVLEILLFALSAFSYHEGAWALGAVFSFALGVVFTYTVDRIRRMRQAGAR